MTTYVTVLKSGGTYTPEWVRKIKAAIERQSKGFVEFVCLTDTPLPSDIYAIPLEFDLPGWWSKLELFRPELFTRDPIVYLDLDTLVLRDPKMLERQSSGFTAVNDFYHPGRLNSCAMSWQGNYSFILRKFLINRELLMAKYRKAGDQAYIEDVMAHMKSDFQFYPSHVVQSFKKSGRTMKPTDATVVQFHGRPKPDASETPPWVKEYWNE